MPCSHRTQAESHPQTHPGRLCSWPGLWGLRPQNNRWPLSMGFKQLSSDSMHFEPLAQSVLTPSEQPISGLQCTALASTQTCGGRQPWAVTLGGTTSHQATPGQVVMTRKPVDFGTQPTTHSITHSHTNSIDRSLIHFGTQPPTHSP